MPEETNHDLLSRIVRAREAVEDGDIDLAIAILDDLEVELVAEGR